MFLSCHGICASNRISIKVTVLQQRYLYEMLEDLCSSKEIPQMECICIPSGDILSKSHEDKIILMIKYCDWLSRRYIIAVMHLLVKDEGTK
jgi:hypothetical protein